MKQIKSAYELSQSQVATPPCVVKLFWQLTHSHRQRFQTVLDLGAGDGRFATGGNFAKYVGIEIDRRRLSGAKLPKHGQVLTGCAFEHSEGSYDACVGNPPYVRHHDIEAPWKSKIVDRIKADLEVTLNKKCNLYLYFVCLGLLKTKDNGLLSFVVPFEWVSRPSAEPVRALIRRHGWGVNVYRFRTSIFPSVLTTASITVVDKSITTGRWSFFDIDEDQKVTPRRGIVDHPAGPLKYGLRGQLWAMRGMSPGSQRLFCLTEGERIHHGLRPQDVIPCVTTLREVPHGVTQLTQPVFRRHFVRAGARCWLVKCHSKRCSKVVRTYLDSIQPAEHDNYTCNSREPWYRYAVHPIPRLLVSSGFTGTGPKVLLNCLGAHAVGAVTGIHGDRRFASRQLHKHLVGLALNKLVVPHAKSLKKIEVRQLNTVLNDYVHEATQNAGHGSR
jgi:hypothetical protein